MNNMPSFGPSAFLKFELLPSLIAGFDLNTAAIASAFAAVALMGIALGMVLLRTLPTKAARIR